MNSLQKTISFQVFEVLRRSLRSFFPFILGNKLFYLHCVFFFLFKLNWILFCATLWGLRPTLANMKSDISQSKDTRYEPGVFNIVFA